MYLRLIKKFIYINMAQIIKIEVSPLKRTAFLTTETAALLNINKKRLEQWNNRGIIKATGLPSAGRGVPRLYSLKDLLMLMMAKELTQNGMQLESLRDPIKKLYDRLPDDHELYNIPTKPYFFAFNQDTEVFTNKLKEICEIMEQQEGLLVINVTRLQKKVISALQEKQLA